MTLTIYEVNKILSSENKSKIISHFWRCTCNHSCLSEIEKLLGINQSNLSKHIGKLLKLGVLKYKQVHKEKFCFINPRWKTEWFNIVNPVLNARENAPYACLCLKQTSNRSISDLQSET